MTDTIPLARVRDLLTAEGANRTLSREAQLALAHAEATLKISTKDTEELVDKLRELPYLDLVLATKIADVLPQWPEEVRLLASKDRTLLDEDQIKSILELTAHYR